MLSRCSCAHPSGISCIPKNKGKVPPEEGGVSVRPDSSKKTAEGVCVMEPEW